MHGGARICYAGFGLESRSESDIARCLRQQRIIAQAGRGSTRLGGLVLPAMHGGARICYAGFGLESRSESDIARC
ncbi:hypothetical protein CQA09_29335, partial [Klebsiella pneumoniae]